MNYADLDFPPKTGRESVVEMAYAIVAMDEELHRLRNAEREAEEWRQKYSEAINHSIQHSQDLIGNILHAALDEDSGLNRMFRAVERDPKKGEK